MGSEEQYQIRMQALIKELRASEALSYKELAKRLEQQGLEIDAKVLANKVNRGNFSAGFALSLLAALGYHSLGFTTPTKRLTATHQQK